MSHVRLCGHDRTACPHLRGPHLRVPDERPRLRAADRAAGGRGLRRRARGRPGRRGGVQHLRGAGERRQQALRQPRPARVGEEEATRACRSPSVAAWRRRTGRRSPQKAPWVDVVFGTHNIGSLPVLLERARVQEEAQVEILESLEVFPSTLPTKRESAYAAWVSISVGCNNTCTFCIVPALRGKEKDRRPGEILAEIEALVAEGVTEVTLLGQNVNAYGVEFGDRQAFSKLLRACGEIEGLERVRFTSPHPAEFTDDVIEAMAETPNVMPSLHMPLQSGSDRVLQGDAPLLPSVEVPRHHRPRPRRHAGRRDHHRHHRRLPRRDRGGLPGHPRRRTGGAVLRRVHLPVLQAPRHPRRRPRRTRCRRPSCRSATSGSSRWPTRSPGRRTARSRAAPSS